MDGKQINTSKRSSEDDTIKILIGPDRQVFYIDEPLLIDKVPYFKLQFEDKGDNTAIELSSVSVNGFRHVVSWLYTGNLPTLVSDNGIFDEAAFDAMYKVAEFLMIAELKSKLRAYVCPVARTVRVRGNMNDKPSSR